MNEQIPSESVTPPLNRPGESGPAQADPAQAQKAATEAQSAASPPSGLGLLKGGLLKDDPSGAAAPSAAQAAARPASDTKAGWSRAPEPGCKTSSDDDDIDQMRRDDRYLEAMVKGVPRAVGEDGQGDLALAREIHAAVEPRDIFDRWQVEELFHGRREVMRYRTQRVALPRAARFKAIVMLLMQYKNVFSLEPTKTAMDYLGPPSAEREQARNFLRGCNITDAAINVQAAELHEKTIAALDRLVAQGHARLGSIVREVKRDKRKETKEKAKEKAKRSKQHQPNQPELALN